MQLDGKTIQSSIMQLIEDYKFDPYQVMEIVKLGLRSAFKKDYLPNEKKVQLQVNIEKDGTIRVFREYEVVQEIEEQWIQMLLEDAQKIRKDIKEGEMVLMDITPEQLEFSRIAVQAAAQTIKQNLKNIERERFYEKFQHKQGELLRAKVLRVNGDSIVLDIEGTTVVLGPEGQIPGRVYNPGEEIFVLLREISKGLGGITLTITQSSQDFIEAILRKIVPELEEEKVVIRRIVRIPGKRSKLLVSANDEKVDPVGVFVGQRADRINTILTLLDGEKIDFIEYIENDDIKLIADSLKPARIESIELKGKRAIVTIPEEQKPLAFGKAGSNIKLASQLTGYQIEIK